MAKIVSPSPGVWTGEIARAYPSWAICATLRACTLVSAALVATTPMVVFSTGRAARGRPTAPERSITRASAKPLPSAVRTPATTRPVAGSMMSPAALTATSAATTSPSARVMDAVPMPDFVMRVGPAIFPTVAPAPAPIEPSATGPSVAARAAAYPHSAVGRTLGFPPTPRSNRIAAGTMGTFAMRTS